MTKTLRIEDRPAIRKFLVSIRNIVAVQEDTRILNHLCIFEPLFAAFRLAIRSQQLNVNWSWGIRTLQQIIRVRTAHLCHVSQEKPSGKCLAVSGGIIDST